MVEDFPGYTDVRALLPLWISLSRGSLRRLCEDLTASAEDRFQAELGSPVDSWVLDNLEGEDRALARLIWEGSRRSVDPRNLSGFWQLIDGHRLLREDPGGHLRLGSTGRCFLENPGGRAEQEIDEREGLHRLLLLLGERTPLARGVLFDSWREFAVRRNRLPAGSSLRLAFLSRLKNLLARGLVERTRSDYRLTPVGYEHLTRSAATLQDVCQSHLALDLQKFLQEQRESILSTLRESLRQMSICRQALLLQDLFEEMGYEDLRPLDPIHEQRLELLGRIQDGISPLSVLIRFHSQTHPLGPDQILETRRSMDHWSAHRGCLVTTGSFTSEALALSLKEGQKPVSLVHGDHLVELLVQFGLGVQKRFVEVWELDLDGLNSDRAQ
jgi:restriction system protein